MKMYYIGLVLTLMFSCVSPISPINENELAGKWESHDYSCDTDFNIHEKIMISRQDDRYVAIKLTGDNCINVGDTTWYAYFENGVLKGKIFGLNPETYQIQKYDCTFQKVMEDLHLLVEGKLALRYRKVDEA